MCSVYPALLGGSVLLLLICVSPCYSLCSKRTTHGTLQFGTPKPWQSPSTETHCHRLAHQILRRHSVVSLSLVMSSLLWLPTIQNWCVKKKQLQEYLPGSFIIYLFIFFKIRIGQARWGLVMMDSLVPRYVLYNDIELLFKWESVPSNFLQIVKHS